MNVLHTSDWHLGRSLYGKKRYEEFTSFLQWLEQTIRAENIEILLIAGDVFDTATPSNKAQSLYYEFLYKLSFSCCRHVVIIGGNHDSPSFLNAPSSLLKVLNVHVVGAMKEDPKDEVILLRNNDIPEALICAVPYLRDRDIRTHEAGEDIDQKNKKLNEGLKKHYFEVCEHAKEIKNKIEQDHDVNLPVIGMGHLFAAGGETVEGDGVRELYVGGINHVGVDAFPKVLDYVALGHLHVPQFVSKSHRVRYSGSLQPLLLSLVCLHAVCLLLCAVRSS